MDEHIGPAGNEEEVEVSEVQSVGLAKRCPPRFSEPAVLTAAVIYPRTKKSPGLVLRTAIALLRS